MRQDLLTVIDAIDHALKLSKVPKSDISEVVLAGGSTNIPLVRNLISEYFHKDNVPIHILSHLNATEVVAIGAAIQGAVLSDEGPSGCTFGFQVNMLGWGTFSSWIHVSKPNIDIYQALKRRAASCTIL